MRALAIFLAFLCSLQSFGNPMFNKLCEINKCWKEQKDISKTIFPAYSEKADEEWIKLHLSLVEQTLRSRNTTHLTTVQKQNRFKSLDDLHQYWQAGRFPQNGDYTYRTPIFIDKHDNFCAVGYLVKASGHEDVSRMIASKTNLAYVREMNYSELFAWAEEYGFTVDELAWIQPSYPPSARRFAAPIGKGTDGVVNELFVDSAALNLYVGGKFTKVDDSIAANNIAYLTEQGGNYTWHEMGTGVNGPVYAIEQYKGKIYAAGKFDSAGGVHVNNVACWDGSSWHAVGCTYGTVRDLLVHNDVLYAAGDFDVCAAMMEVNFAKWNDTIWFQVENPLYGHINVIESVDSNIILGGDFIYNSVRVNIAKWNFNSGMQTFGNNIQNEVMTIQQFNDTIYAGCKKTTVSDDIFKKLNNNTWDSLTAWLGYSMDTLAINTLCADHDTLMAGGSFFYPGGPALGLGNSLSLRIKDDTTFMGAQYKGVWFKVNDAMNKLVVFKGDLIAGGKFKHAFTVTGSNIDTIKLNGIARKSIVPVVSVKQIKNEIDVAKLYPNPASDVVNIEFNKEMSNVYISIVDLAGKMIASQQERNTKKAQINTYLLPAGIYILSIQDKKGCSAQYKIIKH
jgi:hypothetical protein